MKSFSNTDKAGSSILAIKITDNQTDILPTSMVENILLWMTIKIDKMPEAGFLLLSNSNLNLLDDTKGKSPSRKKKFWKPAPK